MMTLQERLGQVTSEGSFKKKKKNYLGLVHAMPSTSRVHSCSAIYYTRAALIWNLDNFSNLIDGEEYFIA